MTREEAKEKYGKWTHNPVTRDELIDIIYDDIGDCEKCKHSYIGGSVLRCNKQNGLIKENEDYCSDFEERI